MLSMVFRNSTSDKTHSSKFFENVLNIVTKELKIKDSFSVSVNLVGEKKIQELNKKYHHKNKPTDVLSFPIGGKYVICNTKYLIRDFGDIFICLSIAKNEAKRENISINNKLAQLTVHGFLHLMGYDHEISEADANEMFKLEERILDKIKF